MNKFVEKPWSCGRALSACGLVYAVLLVMLMLLGVGD